MAKGLISRRAVIVGAAAAATGCRQKQDGAAATSKSAVFVGKAASYSVDLAAVIESGLRACGLNPAGKNILLKPNLVEFDSATCINTHAAVVGAAWAVFTKMGAASVRIAEGPGHRRDTLYLADEAEYFKTVTNFERHFVDLNRNDISAAGAFDSIPEFYFPQTALAADLIVSLPKMKTHHWAGATLSMKNLFGLVPGAVYGWPKNVLHQVGIPKSIVAVNRTFRKTFAIVDGVVGMQGNGPINGTPKPCGVLVMGSDLVAVDATCCRVMGIDPDKIEYLKLAEELGNRDELLIEQRGEPVQAVRSPFELIKEFSNVRLS